MGIGKRSATIQEIRYATSYSDATVRDAVRGLALARFVVVVEGHPVRYFVRPDQWAAIIGAGSTDEKGDLPYWRDWKTTLAFLSHVDELARTCRSQSASEYLQSSRAREVFFAHRSAFANNRIAVPDPALFRGTAYLKAFGETVQAIAKFAETQL